MKQDLNKRYKEIPKYIIFQKQPKTYMICFWIKQDALFQYDRWQPLSNILLRPPHFWFTGWASLPQKGDMWEKKDSYKFLITFISVFVVFFSNKRQWKDMFSFPSLVLESKFDRKDCRFTFEVKIRFIHIAHIPFKEKEHNGACIDWIMG